MNVLIFLVVLVALILVHEFGHFIIAKRSGIRVDEFGIGFPPRLFGKKFGETLYSINLLPFGGFVRIYGENPEEVTETENGRALVHAPKYIQAAVLFGGVFFNIIFAWILFSGVFMVGTPTLVTEGDQYQKYISDTRVMVMNTLAGSPADRAGLAVGDEIVSIIAAGERVEPSYATDVSAFVASHGEEAVEFEVARGGEVYNISTQAEAGIIESDPETYAIGIGIGRVGTLTLPPHRAVIVGAEQTALQLVNVAKGIATLLYDALLFRADLSGIAGPVGIVSLVGSASAHGLIALANFVALISLNLAVINLIPFPALDGGRLLFLAIEAVKGSRITLRVAQTFNLIGFALLILLMLAVTYNDILRLLS
ncbi:MAG: site-2 protease family protein [Candidatus Pacebacteria bacterium]|nr:site-2 protease family protein [Candidatus Paceibacterota bacterium]